MTQSGPPQSGIFHTFLTGSLALLAFDQSHSRFESPAGNLLPTECPGGNYCGTNIPVWMKGELINFMIFSAARTFIFFMYLLKKTFSLVCQLGYTIFTEPTYPWQ